MCTSGKLVAIAMLAPYHPPFPYGCLLLRSALSAALCSLFSAWNTIPSLVTVRFASVGGRCSARLVTVPWGVTPAVTLPISRKPIRCAASVLLFNSLLSCVLVPCVPRSAPSAMSSPSAAFSSSSSVAETLPSRLLDGSSPLSSRASSTAPAPDPSSPSTSDPLLLSALSEPKSRSLLLSCEAELSSLLSAPSHSSGQSHTIRDVSSFQRMLLTRLGRRWGFEVRGAHDSEAASDDKERSAGGAAHGEAGEEKEGGEDSLTFIRTAQSRPPPQLLSHLAKQTDADERSFRSRSPAAGALSSPAASAYSSLAAAASPASLKIMQRASSTEPGAPSLQRPEARLTTVGGAVSSADNDVDEETAIRQREEEYERIRARIFADEPDDDSDDVWRSVSIRREGEQLLNDAASMSSIGESGLSEGSTDSGRLREEAAKRKSLDLLARLDSTAGDDSRSKKVGSGVEAADMHLYNRRLYPASVGRGMTPYSLPFYPSTSFPSSYPATFSQPQYYPSSQYTPSPLLPQPSAAALNSADINIQAAINKLRLQQASDTITASSSAAASGSSRPPSASSVTSPTFSSAPAVTSATTLTQAQRAAGFVDVATLQHMNSNAPVFTPSYAKQQTTHTPQYSNRGMAAMPAGMQFVSAQPASASPPQPSAPASSTPPYSNSPYAAAVSSTSPQLPQGFRAVRPTNPSSSPYSRNAPGYQNNYTSQPSGPPGQSYQPLSGNAYGYPLHSYNQQQQIAAAAAERPSAGSPTSISGSEPSQRSPSLDAGSNYPMYINTFVSSTSLSPSSQSRPQPVTNSPSPIGPPSSAASSIRSRALSLPTSSDPILEQPLPSRRYSHVMDGNVASLSSLSLSSSASPTVSSPSFSSANDPIVQPSSLSASSLSSPTSIQQQQQQQKQHTLFSSPTASSSPFSPFSFQASPFLSSSSSDLVTGAPLFSLIPAAASLTSPIEQRREVSETDRRNELDASKRNLDDDPISAAISPLRSSPSSANAAAGALDVVFRSAPKLFISNSNGPTAQQQLTAADTANEGKGSRDSTVVPAAAGRHNGANGRENEQESAGRVRDTSYVSAPSIRITSPSPSPSPAITSNPVITIYPSSMQPGARKTTPALAFTSASASGSTASSTLSVASTPSTVSFASMVRHSMNKQPLTAVAPTGSPTPSTAGNSAAPTSPLSSPSTSSSSSSSTSPSLSAMPGPVVHKNPLITIRPSAWSQGPAAVEHNRASSLSPALASSPSASASSSAASSASSAAAGTVYSASVLSTAAPSATDTVWTAVGGGGRRK